MYTHHTFMICASRVYTSSDIMCVYMRCIHVQTQQTHTYHKQLITTQMLYITPKHYKPAWLLDAHARQPPTKLSFVGRDLDEATDTDASGLATGWDGVELGCHGGGATTTTTTTTNCSLILKGYHVCSVTLNNLHKYIWVADQTTVHAQMFNRASTRATFWHTHTHTHTHTWKCTACGVWAETANKWQPCIIIKTWVCIQTCVSRFDNVANVVSINIEYV